jgi:rhamnosyltransferase subunit B
MATFGSLGDVYPFLAIGQGLKARGHEPIIATSASYRAVVEAAGLAFHPTPPDHDDFPEPVGDVVHRASHPHTGTEFVLRQLILPFLRNSFETLATVGQGADLIVSHPLAYGAPLLAELLGVPWAATVPSPAIFHSSFDPPVLASAPWLAHLPAWRYVYGALRELMRHRSRPWIAPIVALRRELGLPPTNLHPLFEGQFSPFLNLALFSSMLGQPQPDWPERTILTGFPFFDRSAAASETERVDAFLATGPTPIVFALSSSATVNSAGFYQTSADVAARLGRRALLVIGNHPNNRLVRIDPESALAVEYAPFDEVFPRAAAIVHAGGVGTTGQALRAGKPALIVPHGHDQRDNGARVARLGAGLVLDRDHYTPGIVTRRLAALLDEPSFASNANRVAEIVRQESGVASACAAIEGVLNGRVAQAHG